MEQRFLGEILHRRAGVALDRLETLYTVQREKGIDLVDLLVNGNVLDETAIAKALADEAELPYIDKPEVDRISTQLATRLPIGFAKSHKILVTNEDDFSVFVTVGDPFDTTALDEIRILFSKTVEATVAPSERIEDAINRVYEREAGGGELESDEEQVDDDAAGDILDSDDEAPVIRWVNSLFLQAMKERASDIHIEPEEKEVIVRYRIDGELYVARRAPRAFMSSIVSRIKIESSLNIAEKRLPQDGRITKKIAGKGFDIRVSTIPTSRGYERIVMRLLNKSSVLLDLPDLGFSARDYALMDQLIHKPDGIILVTGPTGSGKTTTLYACLNRINQPNINILTAEDPVEYELAQIHQVHVNAKIGLTFASALRAFLRQDPDVVMVGEIRDKETVEIAINASLTGHLVLSTIHTNDAAGAFTRMVDMGVEPFLLRSSVVGILAQRLVRVLCPHCKEAYEASPTDMEELGVTEERAAARRKRMQIPSSRYYPRNVASADPLESVPDRYVTLFKPKGCDKCAQTGFMGRRGIYELLMMDDIVGPLVLKGADAQAIKRAAIEQGMDSLRDDGARKVLAGLTSLEEILGATQDDVEADTAPTSVRNVRVEPMAVWVYNGLAVKSGKKVSGVRDADNPKILRALLKREGVLLTEASEEKRGKKQGRSIDLMAFFRRVSIGDVAMLTRQLATLVGAGIPLVEAVSAMIEQVEKEELQKTLALIRDRLNEGTSLAKALEPHPHIFPPIYTNMVAAGEVSGTLETVLERLSDFMEKQAHLRSKVGGALAYPILMLLLGTGLMTVMLTVVVPKVTSIYATLDRALPWYTALLIFVSAAISSNQMLGFMASFSTLVFTRKALAPGTKRTAWVVAAILGASALVLFLFAVASKTAYFVGIGIGVVFGLAMARLLMFISTPAGQVWKDGILLRLPLFGPVFRMLAVSRFSRTLATLLKSGVPLLKAMEIVRHVLDNAMLSKIVEEATGSIREGESIAGPLKRSKQFPPIVVHMIAVGERSGQLENMLENVSRAYDAQVETRVQAMTSLLEPLIIVFMGGGVGFIAFSILMPLIQMNDFVQ